jgi:hypothetical protein
MDTRKENIYTSENIGGFPSGITHEKRTKSMALGVDGLFL